MPKQLIVLNLFILNPRNQMIFILYVIRNKIITANKDKNTLKMKSHLEQQTLRITQVEDYHPAFRRRAYTSIRTSFPTFFSFQNENSSMPVSQSQRIITQSFAKINQIIDLVDDHIRHRIESYQGQVVNVVQKQIEQMRQQTDKVVTQFNTMIQQKNKENQIWSLNNELDYFKNQAKKLFDLNRTLKKQNFEMKKKFQEYEQQLENREVIMQKLLIKYQKEKFHKQKIKTILSKELQNIQKSQYKINKLSKPAIMQFSLKDDLYQLEQTPSLKLQSLINIDSEKPQKQSKSIKKKNQQSQNFIFQNQSSLLQIQYDDQSDISKIQFKKKSVNIIQPTPEMKDKQLQVNIYLSQHSYKNLFDKKISPKIIQKTLNAATQTEKEKNVIITKDKTNFIQSSQKVRKFIDFNKNGFYVNDLIMKKTHHRSITSQNNSSYKDNFYDRKEEKQRLETETNFNKTLNKHSQIELIAQSSQKRNKKIYKKMAHRFQHNKIVKKTQSKSKVE